MEFKSLPIASTLLNLLNIQVSRIGLNNSIKLSLPEYPILVEGTKLVERTTTVSSVKYFENQFEKLYTEFTNNLSNDLMKSSKEERKLLLIGIKEQLDCYHFYTKKYEGKNLNFKRALNKRNKFYEKVSDLVQSKSDILIDVPLEKGIKKKLNWEKDPKLFYILFAALQEAGFIEDDTENLGINLEKIFNVKKDKGKGLAKPSTFTQNLKRKSSTLLTKKENKKKMNEITAFLNDLRI